MTINQAMNILKPTLVFAGSFAITAAGHAGAQVAGTFATGPALGALAYAAEKCNLVSKKIQENELIGPAIMVAGTASAAAFVSLASRVSFPAAAGAALGTLVSIPAFFFAGAMMYTTGNPDRFLIGPALAPVLAPLCGIGIAAYLNS